MSPSLIAVLKDHRDKTAMYAVLVGLPQNDQSLVFCWPDGRPYRPLTVTWAWRNTIVKAGVKRIRLHDSRHTHASLMLKQGVHVKVVSERLGHTSVAITLDTYSHILPGIQEAAAMRFDEVFLEAQNDLGEKLGNNSEL